MLALVILFHVAAVLGQEYRTCPGGYTHGTQVDRGHYWYECQDGQLVPKGCFAEDQHRMNLYDTYDTPDGLRLQCIVGNDGFVSFAYKSCVNQGKEYQVGQGWDDGNNFYKCSSDREFVKIDVAGCIDNVIGRAAVGEKISKGDFVYECKKANDNTFSVRRVGCHYEGRQYAVGDTFTKTNNLWYMCTTKGNDYNAEVIHKIIGCVHEGTNLRDGEHFVRDEVLWGCRISDDDTKIVPFACITYEGGVMHQRRINCTYTAGDEPIQYDVTCKKVEPNSATTEYVRCLYTVPQGTHNINPGCYRIIDNKVVGCVKDTRRLEVRILSIDNLASAPSLGLRFC